MFNKKVLPVGQDLFIIKRTFKIDPFQMVLDEFGAKVVCENYNCETILRGKDGMFYLCDKIDDAKIIQ
jgi:hypothetical protein